MANSRGVFVTGTDTGVGKTVVSAALMIRLRPLGPVCYWKPIQTGIEQDDDTAEVASLAVASSAELLTDGVRLRRPLSPHLAARLSETAIELDPLVEISRRVPASTHLIVEGAGGALVPINDRDMMTDLMARLALPVIVAARSGLGTINHTLLTLEALRKQRLKVAAVVLVGPPNADNRAAIEHFGEVPVAGEMPMFAPLNAEQLAAWSVRELDPDHRLIESLR